MSIPVGNGCALKVNLIDQALHVELSWLTGLMSMGEGTQFLSSLDPTFRNCKGVEILCNEHMVRNASQFHLAFSLTDLS